MNGPDHLHSDYYLPHAVALALAAQIFMGTPASVINQNASQCQLLAWLAHCREGLASCTRAQCEGGLCCSSKVRELDEVVLLGQKRRNVTASGAGGYTNHCT